MQTRSSESFLFLSCSVSLLSGAPHQLCSLINIWSVPPFFLSRHLWKHLGIKVMFNLANSNGNSCLFGGYQPFSVFESPSCFLHIRTHTHARGVFLPCLQYFSLVQYLGKHWEKWKLCKFFQQQILPSQLFFFLLRLLRLLFRVHTGCPLQAAHYRSFHISDLPPELCCNQHVVWETKSALIMFVDLVYVLCVLM